MVSEEAWPEVTGLFTWECEKRDGLEKGEGGGSLKRGLVLTGAVYVEVWKEKRGGSCRGCLPGSMEGKEGWFLQGLFTWQYEGNEGWFLQGPFTWKYGRKRGVVLAELPRKKPPAVGVTCMAIYCLTPGFRGRTFELWVLLNR